MGRIIIFTGKGGVGKSSIASAHALKASKEGKKTLIISTDMAHNLSDIFVKDISEEPVEISENLGQLRLIQTMKCNIPMAILWKALKI